MAVTAPGALLPLGPVGSVRAGARSVGNAGAGSAECRGTLAALAVQARLAPPGSLAAVLRSILPAAPASVVPARLAARLARLAGHLPRLRRSAGVASIPSLSIATLAIATPLLRCTLRLATSLPVRSAIAPPLVATLSWGPGIAATRICIPGTLPAVLPRAVALPAAAVIAAIVSAPGVSRVPTAVRAGVCGPTVPPVPIALPAMGGAVAVPEAVVRVVDVTR